MNPILPTVGRWRQEGQVKVISSDIEFKTNLGYGRHFLITPFVEDWGGDHFLRVEARSVVEH